MTRAEQRKLIEELRLHTKKFSAAEASDFEMMVKRDKDDEDLDTLTRDRLLALHENHCPRRSKSEIEDRWKKITEGKK